MPRPRTVSLMTKDELRKRNRETAQRYDELASFGYYTDAELLVIRGEIWQEVFQGMAVDMGINQFDPNEMTQSDVLRLLATMMEKR